MFRIEASGQTCSYCNGMSRRSFLQLGVDPGISFLDLTGRPIPAIPQGKVIHELI